MKHAFLILAHQDSQMLKMLLRLLDVAENDIYLHIDRRAVAMRQSFSTWKSCQAGFYLLRSPIAVYWGDISLLDAEMLLFQTAFEHGPYAYYHLLSGADFPLRPMSELYAFFEAHEGHEFVHYWQSPQHECDLLRKVSRHYIFTHHLRDKDTLIHALTAPLRNSFLAIQKAIGYKKQSASFFRQGSNWVSITQDFCLYLLQHAPALRQRLRHALCPDEIFLQTILWHSPYRKNIFSMADDIESSSLRKIDWERGHPYAWQETDFDELKNSQAFFARKITSEQSVLVHLLEKVCLES